MVGPVPRKRVGCSRVCEASQCCRGERADSVAGKSRKIIRLEMAHGIRERVGCFKLCEEIVWDPVFRAS